MYVVVLWQTQYKAQYRELVSYKSSGPGLVVMTDSMAKFYGNLINILLLLLRSLQNS